MPTAWRTASRLLRSSRASGAPPTLLRTSRRAYTSAVESTRALPSWVKYAGIISLSAFTLYSARPLALESPAAIGQDRKKLPVMTAEEIQNHTGGATWVVIDGTVWDVSAFVKKHPAGPAAIIEHAGKDITSLFNMLHPKGTFSKIIPQLTAVGVVDPDTAHELEQGLGDADEIQMRRDNLPDPEVISNLHEFEIMAKEVLGKDSRAFNYFSSWSDDGATYEATRTSYSYLRFLPRVNVPVRDIDTSTTYLNGTFPVPIPIFGAPTGQWRNGHPEGEANFTRAAASFLFPQGLSNGASLGIDEITIERDDLVEAGGGRVPIWWQIYIKSNRAESEEMLRKVKNLGADAIIITVDVPALGNRESDGKIIGPGGKVKKAAGLAATDMGATFDANMTWTDIAWVKKHAPGLPVLVKGITCPDDVALAKKFGADGVVLSNHGGRQLDFAPPPLSTLVRLRKERPELLEDARFDVFIDGGIRRGTDVLKALCLGAKGVGLGRAMLYAQTCYGDEGITRVFEILNTEIQTGMKLLGARRISDLKPEMIELMPGLVGERLR